MQSNDSLLIDFCNSLITFNVAIKELKEANCVYFISEMKKVSNLAEDLTLLYSDKEEAERQGLVKLIKRTKEKLETALRYYEPSISEKFEEIFTLPIIQRRSDYKQLVASFRSLDDLGKQSFLDAYVFMESESIVQEECEIRTREEQKLTVEKEVKQALRQRETIIKYLLYGGQHESLLRSMDYSKLSFHLDTLNFQENIGDNLNSVNELSTDAIDDLFEGVKQRLRICYEILSFINTSISLNPIQSTLQIEESQVKRGPYAKPNKDRAIAYYKSKISDLLDLDRRCNRIPEKKRIIDTAIKATTSSGVNYNTFRCWLSAKEQKQIYDEIHQTIFAIN